MNAKIEREVSASRAEYQRGLLLAYPDAQPVANQVWRIDDGQAVLEITVAELSPRVIAKLRLPRLRLTLEFLSGSPEAQRALLNRLDLAMQRGGG